MLSLFDKNQRWRKKALATTKDESFRQYLLNDFPKTSQTVSETEFLVLDFETTGLDSKKDHIISAGWVEISKNKIQLASAEHHLISTKKQLSGQSVSIHNLTDDMISQGVPITIFFKYLLKKITGKVVIAHYKKIEYEFLQQISNSIFGCHLPIIMLDTLMIEKKIREKANKPIVVNELRLFNLRNHYNLPRYHAHNALEDAIATAELFLAQINKHFSSPDKLKIKALLY
ncbi:MAG: hypothetical protein KDI76_00190 [Xanthomonadales bacterium]|nr:hypothetical protein [Xanthomonadales bacterium]